MGEKIFIGTFEGRDSLSIPTALFEQAASALNAQAKQRRREAEAAAADTLRQTNTKWARAVRHFRRAP
jgi:hypothetical protein